MKQTSLMMQLKKLTNHGGRRHSAVGAFKSRFTVKNLHFP